MRIMIIGDRISLTSAVEDAIDRIRDTATSYERVFVVEVMGKKHGFIAVEVVWPSLHR